MSDQPRRQRSLELLERARRVIPGGVNSPVRAFRSVGGDPPFLARAQGCRLWDVDGNVYLDLVGSWGPMILGHAAPVILEAIASAAAAGTSFGAPTEREVVFAETISRLLPSVEKVRLTSSGTEATMSALRLARGATGRSKVIKIEGGYHGHADAFLVRAGSGAMTFGVPDSAGVPAAIAADTLTIPYNDLDAVRSILASAGKQIAALIVEPVCGNMGVVAPAAGYLEGLRELTRPAGVLLIFDEVITGFRVALGGAQGRFGVTPDLTCLGKIIGGGLPVGAYGGRADLMSLVAPEGPVYQAGTLSGNPLAVAAGQAALDELARSDPYPGLEQLGSQLERGLLEIGKEAGVPMTVNRVGSMLTAFFCEGPVIDYATAKQANTAGYARFHREMLRLGVYLAPSQFEAAFVSTAHTRSDLDRVLSAARQALRAI